MSPSAASTALFILLHGVGSNGRDMAPLGDALRSVVPGAAFAAPNAPTALGSGGFQWFSIAGITDANRPARITAARPAFDAIIAGLVKQQGFESRLDRVFLIGFSQGSMMLLDAVASGRWPVAGAIAFSGRLASERPLAPATSTRLLLVHGDADPVVPVRETIAAAQTLENLGVPVESHVLPGLGHTISNHGLNVATAFITATLAAKDSDAA